MGFFQIMYNFIKQWYLVSNLSWIHTCCQFKFGNPLILKYQIIQFTQECETNTSKISMMLCSKLSELVIDSQEEAETLKRDNSLINRWREGSELPLCTVDTSDT